MIKISAIQPINNAISSGYPFVEAILPILHIVNEVLINDGGSLDETPFYLKKLFLKKLKFLTNYFTLAISGKQ